MPLVLHPQDPSVSMTSQCISKMAGLCHRKTKQAIERLVKKEIIRRPSSDQTSSHYIFSGQQGKCDSIIMVAHLSPEFTAKLVYRWRELELQARQIRDAMNWLRQKSGGHRVFGRGINRYW